MLFEDRLIYFPEGYPAGDWDAPRRGRTPVEDVWPVAADGVRLHGWLARGEGARCTLLYFHGNAGNLTYRYDWLCALASLPADVLLLDYRGYGRSQGRPGEEGLYLDGDAAYRYALEELGVPPERIVPYGKSLGGAVACDLAARQPCAGVILQSTFTSAAAMARRMFPFLPARLVRHRLDNLAKVPAISAPTLIVHSRADEMIPFRMARELHEAAAEPKELLAFEGVGHNDLVVVAQEALLAAFRRWLQGILPHMCNPPSLSL